MRVRLRCWDGFTYLAIVAAILVLWNPSIGVRGDKIFVSPAGCNWWSGTGPERALRTIQRAADLARPGDQIIILPGTYFERIHVRHGGASDNPVIFEALEPGSVHISGSLPESIATGWTWSDEGDGIYSTTTRWPVYSLSYEGEALFRVPKGDVESLREIVRRPRAWGAFGYDRQKLYVFLRGGQIPDGRRLATHAPVPEPREWGEFKSANVWVEADHVVFSGLQFEMGIGAGVLVWAGEDVTVRECAFHGATFGIKCGAGTKPSRNVVVENCLYENYPQYFWHRDWLSWGECYAAYSSSSLITAVDDGTRVVNNLVVHAGDGLRITTNDVAIREGLEVSSNWLAFCTDDAIELDGHAKRIHVEDNVVIECHESFSASPVLSGPVTIENNLILNSPTGINGAQLKLMHQNAVADPADVLPISNLDFRHNFAYGNWLCWTDRGPIKNVRVCDNVFCISHLVDPLWPRGVDDQDNLVVVVENRTATATAMMDQLRAAAVDKAQLSDHFATFRRRLERRPGPSWLDWRSSPATQSVEEFTRTSSP